MPRKFASVPFRIIVFVYTVVCISIYLFIFFSICIVFSNYVIVFFFNYIYIGLGIIIKLSISTHMRKYFPPSNYAVKETHTLAIFFLNDYVVSNLNKLAANTLS